MKVIFSLSIILLGLCSLSYSQNNYTISEGVSALHKTTDCVNALNEAIIDAQTNAVIAYGGNIQFTSTTKNSENISLEKNRNTKTKDNFNSDYKSKLIHSVNAMAKTIEITADTIWVDKVRYKVRVKGKFDVNMKELGNYIADYLDNTDSKIRIEIIENDCFGHIYKTMSEYMNCKRSNFLFSNQPWLIGEGDYKIEINSDYTVLFDKRFKPNVIIKRYPYHNCQNLLNEKKGINILLDEIINDIYTVYTYKSIK
jgi:hypothetical protein